MPALRLQEPVERLIGVEEAHPLLQGKLQRSGEVLKLQRHERQAQLPLLRVLGLDELVELAAETVVELAEGSLDGGAELGLRLQAVAQEVGQDGLEAQEALASLCGASRPQLTASCSTSSQRSKGRCARAGCALSCSVYCSSAFR